jgi:hypothetical protein
MKARSYEKKNRHVWTRESVDSVTFVLPLRWAELPHRQAAPPLFRTEEVDIGGVAACPWDTSNDPLGVAGVKAADLNWL